MSLWNPQGTAGLPGYSSHYRGPEGPWHKYFTWKPRKVNGRWYWLSYIYRRDRNVAVYPHQGYEYGDMFNAIKDAR